MDNSCIDEERIHIGSLVAENAVELILIAFDEGRIQARDRVKGAVEMEGKQGLIVAKTIRTPIRMVAILAEAGNIGPRLLGRSSSAVDLAFENLLIADVVKLRYRKVKDVLLELVAGTGVSVSRLRTTLSRLITKPCST